MGQVEKMDNYESVQKKKIFQLLNSLVILDCLAISPHFKGMKYFTPIEKNRVILQSPGHSLSSFQILTYSHSCFRILFSKVMELCILVPILSCDLGIVGYLHTLSLK